MPFRSAPHVNSTRPELAGAGEGSNIYSASHYHRGEGEGWGDLALCSLSEQRLSVCLRKLSWSFWSKYEKLATSRRAGREVDVKAGGEVNVLKV